MSQYSALSATFKTEVKKKGNKPRVGVALTGIGKYYSRGKAFTMDGHTYADELASAPGLSISAKMTGGLSAVNRLNVDILNQDLVSDLFTNVGAGTYKDPENTAVSAHLVFDSGTTLVADSIQFFKGIIDDFPQIDNKSLKIACTSIDKIVFKKIGELIDADDAPSGYKVPEDSLGRMKPIIYGTHRFGVNYTADNSRVAADYNFTRENNMVECIPIGGGQFFVANHECHSVSTQGSGFWLYDDNLGRMVEVNDFSVVSTNPLIIDVTGSEIIVEASTGSISDGVLNKFADATGTPFSSVAVGDYLVIPFDGNDENPGTYKIKSITDNNNLVITAPYFSADGDDSNIEYTIERYPNFTDWRSPIGAANVDTGGWVNLDRVHDLSIATAATAAFDAGDPASVREFTAEFGVTPISQNKIISAKIYIKGNSTNHADLFLAVNNDAISSFSEKTNTTEFHKHAYDLKKQYLNNAIILFHKVAGTAAGTASIYEVIQQITYNKNISTDNMKIYFGGRGMEYGTWINSRTGHQDDGNAGSLIENAAGVVESILYDWLAVTSNINETAFNTASAGDLSASKLSFSLTEITKSDDLIHGILERVKSVGMFDYDDKFKMVVYDSTDDFTESGSGTPNDDDKFLSPPTESGNYADNTRQFDEHPIIKNSFWIKKNPATQIVTNFTVDYYKTHDGNLARQLTDTDTTYHAEDISKIFSHPYTKDTATAQIWLTFLKDRLNRKHWACGWDTWFNAIGKEMWDVVNVQDPVIASLLTSYTTKKWRILKLGIETDLGKMSIEVEEQ